MSGHVAADSCLTSQQQDPASSQQHRWIGSNDTDGNEDLVLGTHNAWELVRKVEIWVMQSTKVRNKGNILRNMASGLLIQYHYFFYLQI
jgi:hypothetical protein